MTRRFMFLVFFTCQRCRAFPPLKQDPTLSVTETRGQEVSSSCPLCTRITSCGGQLQFLPPNNSSSSLFSLRNIWLSGCQPDYTAPESVLVLALTSSAKPTFPPKCRVSMLEEESSSQRQTAPGGGVPAAPARTLMSHKVTSGLEP